jgi:hypothetical protein
MRDVQQAIVQFVDIGLLQANLESKDDSRRRAPSNSRPPARDIRAFLVNRERTWRGRGQDEPEPSDKDENNSEHGQKSSIKITLIAEEILRCCVPKQ